MRMAFLHYPKGIVVSCQAIMKKIKKVKKVLRDRELLVDKYLNLRKENKLIGGGGIQYLNDKEVKKAIKGLKEKIKNGKTGC